MGFFKKYKLKYRLKRYLAKKRIKRNRMPKTEESIQKAFLIFKEMVKNPKCYLMVAPLSDRKYIHDKERDIFVSLYDTNLTIINTVYQYDIRLSDKEEGYLKNLFNNALEKRRLRFENKMRSKVDKSLSTILENINNEKNRSKNY